MLFILISVRVSNTISKTSVTSRSWTTNPSRTLSLPPPPPPPALSRGSVLISYGCTIKRKFTASTKHSIFWSRVCQNGIQNDPKYSNNGNIYNKVEDVRVSLVEQELLTLPKHLSSSPVFSRVHFAQYLVICVVFYRSVSLYFWQLYCMSLIYGLWLSLWYLQTFHVNSTTLIKQHLQEEKKQNNG